MPSHGAQLRCWRLRVDIRAVPAHLAGAESCLDPTGYIFDRQGHDLWYELDVAGAALADSFIKRRHRYNLDGVELVACE